MNIVRPVLQAAKVAVASVIVVRLAEASADGARRLKNGTEAAIGSGLRSLDEYTKRVKAR